MAVKSSESFWRDQQESLRKLRQEFEELNHHGNDSHRTSRQTDHRRGNPSYLPKLKVPPESPRLRGKKFNVIPPVRQKADGYDSWGEGSDPETEDAAAAAAAVAPFAGYPVMMYPIFVPMPDSNYLHSHSQSSQPRGDWMTTYRNAPLYRHTDSALQSNVRRLLRDPSLVQPRHSRNGIVTNNPPRRPASRDPFVNYVDQFIYECLDEEFVPDLLIDVFQEEEARSTPLMHFTRPQQFDTHSRTQGDALQVFLDDLFDEVIMVEAVGVLRSAAREVAASYVQRSAINDVITDLVDEEMENYALTLLSETLDDIFVEDIAYDFVVRPGIKELATEVAEEITLLYGNRRRKKDVVELETFAGEKLLESMMLEHLLSLFVQQGQLVTEEESSNQILDDILISVLLDQYIDVKSKRSATISNRPLQRYHEKCVTDVALNVILGELCRSLDEDMADLDSFEHYSPQSSR